MVMAMIKEQIIKEAFPTKRTEVPVIVIIDSDFESRRFIFDSLTGSANIRIVETSETKDAMHWLEQNAAPTMIITDFIEMTGYTEKFLTWLRSNPKYDEVCLCLFSSDLYSESLARIWKYDTWMPKGLSADMVEHTLITLLFFEDEEDPEVISLEYERFRRRVDKLRADASMSRTTPGERAFLLSLMSGNKTQKEAIANLHTILTFFHGEE
jgi:hypothetical protein